MTIAITGATGHLGGLALRALLEEQDVPASSLVAVVRDASKAQDLVARGVDVRVADYDDADALGAALRGVGALLLVSGLDFGRRVPQHANVIEAALANGVSFVAYTSAPHADTTTLNVAPEHKATEEMIAASGLPYAFLRNNWYTENYLGAVETARSTGELVSATGAGRVASASRKDLASAAAVVLADPDRQRNRVFELSGASAWDYAQLADAIANVIGAPVRYVPVGADEYADRLASRGVAPGLAAYLVQLDRDIAAGTLADATSDLASLLDRKPTTLVAGLRDPH